MEYPDNSLMEAVAKTDCEPEVRSQLLEILNKWKEKRGFALVKYNREYVKILLELFLLEDRNTSRQVSMILADCLSVDPQPTGPPHDLIGKKSSLARNTGGI